MDMMRALARYWFVVPVLVIIIIGIQLLSDFVLAKGTKLRQQTPFPVVSTSMPTRTLLPTSTATFTPRPTRTPTPVRKATPTPISTFVPTNTPSPVSKATSTPTPTPGPTPMALEVVLDVPILMYHYLSKPPANADIIRRDLSVSPAQFEAQLAYLQQAGYQSITLRQLTYALSGRALNGQETLPPKPIIITFDDGYRDNYQNAFPLLKKYGYTAVFYIFTHPLDHHNPNYLSWDMVREMHRAGMEFGSHGYRHWELAGRDVDFLVYEILGSKEAIETHLGEPVYFFSYPAGRYDALAQQVVESAHFWNAVTTEFNVGQSYTGRYALPRLRVRGTDTVEDLARNLDEFIGSANEF